MSKTRKSSSGNVPIMQKMEGWIEFYQQREQSISERYKKRLLKIIQSFRPQPVIYQK